MELFQKNFKIYFNSIFSHLEILFLIGLRYVGKLVYIKLAIIYINMQYFGSLSVQFGSFRSSLVYFGPFWFDRSITVHFDPIWSILVYTVHLCPFGPLWSIRSSLVHSGLV